MGQKKETGAALFPPWEEGRFCASIEGKKKARNLSCDKKKTFSVSTRKELFFLPNETICLGSQGKGEEKEEVLF